MLGTSADLCGTSGKTNRRIFLRRLSRCWQIRRICITFSRTQKKHNITPINHPLSPRDTRGNRTPGRTPLPPTAAPAVSCACCCPVRLRVCIRQEIRSPPFTRTNRRFEERRNRRPIVRRLRGSDHKRHESPPAPTAGVFGMVTGHPSPIPRALTPDRKKHEKSDQGRPTPAAVVPCGRPWLRCCRPLYPIPASIFWQVGGLSFSVFLDTLLAWH